MSIAHMYTHNTCIYLSEYRKISIIKFKNEVGDQSDKEY